MEGAATSSKNLDAFYKSLPDVKHITLDESLALTVMAMPLSCIDRPHVRPSGGGYLWEATYRPADDYQRTRIFYGCYDWHSAANSMWSLVKSLKLFPKKATAGLIRSRLDKHFQVLNSAIATPRSCSTPPTPTARPWTSRAPPTSCHRA